MVCYCSYKRLFWVKSIKVTTFIHLLQYTITLLNLWLIVVYAAIMGVLASPTLGFLFAMFIYCILCAPYVKGWVHTVDG